MSKRHGDPGHLKTAVVLLLSLVTLGYAAEPVPELVTDRPDQTESSDTVPPGFVQFEFGWTHAEHDEAAKVTTDSVPETLIRLGVVENLELRFGFDGYIWEDVDTPGVGSSSEHGSGDLELGLKWKFWTESGYRPQTALLAGTTLPTGETGFSSERFDPAVRLTCSHTLTETLGLGYNLGANWATEEDADGDRHTETFAIYTVALGIALSEQLGTFVEFFGAIPTDEGKPANAFDGGFTYLIADNLQLDVLAGVGLSEAADDWFVGAGLSWRLPQ